jgi:plasmid stabilization system protein ParE
MRLVTSERAKRDIEDIARYVALDSSQSAEPFDNACELLLHTPEMGSHRSFYNPALDDLRMMRLHNFKNYLIFYRPPRDDKSEIIRVVHGARDLPTHFEYSQFRGLARREHHRAAWNTHCS